MKILVADDHALMREGIQIVLMRAYPGATLLEANNFEQASQCIKEHEDLDLALLDLEMPGESPHSGLTKILNTSPCVPVVVVSASENPADIQQAIHLGARGYIPKSASNENLLAALEHVLSGGTYIPANITESSNKLNQVTLLTRRQKEVLALLASGQSNKEIGRSLGLSEGTVRTHVTAIFRLLGVNNRTQASRQAHELGILNSVI